MGGQYGVTESLKLVRLAAVVGNGIDKAIPLIVGGGILGKLKLASVVMDMAPALISLSSLDKNAFMKEVNEYDEQDKKQLVDTFAIEFDLKNDGVEYTIESVVEAVANAANLVVKFVEVVRSVVGLFVPKAA